MKMRLVLGTVCATSLLLTAGPGFCAGQAWYGGIRLDSARPLYEQSGGAGLARPFGLSPENSALGLRLTLGYHISQHVAVEGGYAPPAFSSSGAGTPNYAQAAPDAAPGSGFAYGLMPRYGLGLQYDIGRNATLSGEWERGGNFTGFGAYGGPSTDRYSIGLRLRF